jgi:hypothetical protein
MAKNKPFFYDDSIVYISTRMNRKYVEHALYTDDYCNFAIIHDLRHINKYNPTEFVYRPYSPTADYYIPYLDDCAHITFFSYRTKHMHIKLHYLKSQEYISATT